jgi:hypothetical protein
LPEIVVRVGALEREVAEIKRRPQSPDNWIARLTGSMKDEPEFDEILRLGRELREAERAAARNEGD